MTVLLGTVLIVGTLAGGLMLYLKTDRLDREIRAQLEERRGR